jgi:2-polyprenyl-3-methyl-5-hydroxy-6-metoxy-1,4-benzoquinol methylase
VSEYHFDAAGPRYACDYVANPVLALCRELGARKVLDLGCGNGEFSRRLAATGTTVVGCDPSASGIEIARRSVPGVTFHRLGVEDDPAALGDANFDTVVAMEVVEHLYAPRLLPRFARQVLAPGGAFVVTTPYHGYLKNLTLSLLGKWDWHLNPLWDGGHIKFWSEKTLRQLIEPEGFRFERFVGAGRLPWLWMSMVLLFRKA